MNIASGLYPDSAKQRVHVDSDEVEEAYQRVLRRFRESSELIIYMRNKYPPSYLHRFGVNHTRQQEESSHVQQYAEEHGLHLILDG